MAHFKKNKEYSIGYGGSLEVRLEIRCLMYTGLQEAECVVSRGEGFGTLLLASNPTSITYQRGLLRQFASLLSVSSTIKLGSLQHLCHAIL